MKSRFPWSAITAATEGNNPIVAEAMLMINEAERRLEAALEMAGRRVAEMQAELHDGLHMYTSLGSAPQDIAEASARRTAAYEFLNAALAADKVNPSEFIAQFPASA